MAKKPAPRLTSHSAYVATSTESHGVKIDGLLSPNFVDSENVSEKFLHRPPSVMILKKVGFFGCFFKVFARLSAFFKISNFQIIFK